MEIWKDIKGYEGLYQVSNEGRVKSIRYRKEKILHQNKVRGYLRTILSKNGVKTQYQTHRLVYETFESDIPNGLQVNHIDENKENNCVENLNLMTPKENMNWGTNRQRAAEKYKKTLYQYDKNNNLICVFDSIKSACEKYNIFQGNISSCCSGRMKTYKGYKWSFNPL